MTVEFGRKSAQKLLPRRQRTDNKTAGGKSLLIAGSQGMFGAAVLAATAAARVGSGYVILMTDQNKFSSARHPDFLVVDWKKKKIADVQASSIGIGPGLGKSAVTLELLKQLLKVRAENVVIDADALNLVAEYNLMPLPNTWIATPHEGELARLLGISAKEIRKDRHKAARRAQKKMGCVILLKGNRTLVATANRIYEIQTGNPALAKAGTGDVLTGMITGFMAQGLAARDSACLGAFVHGWLADQWVREKNDPLSLLPSDLLRAIPKALARIRSY